jgi:glucosyl-3-phosphoglycerate phosphatase
VIRRLLLVRHGVTTWNREGRFQGHLDPPLDPLGEQEARAVASRVVHETTGPVAVVSSPLQRAAATARFVVNALAADGRPVELALEPGIVEIGQGVWEGHTHAELAATDPEGYAAWSASGGYREPPGAEGVPAAASRATAAVERLLAAEDLGHAESLCLVAHGGILRLVAGRLTGLRDEEAWQLDVDNASLSVLVRDAAGTDWRIQAWNDTSHLPPQLTAADRQGEGDPPAL